MTPLGIVPTEVQSILSHLRRSARLGAFSAVSQAVWSNVNPPGKEKSSQINPKACKISLVVLLFHITIVKCLNLQREMRNLLSRSKYYRK